LLSSPPWPLWPLWPPCSLWPLWLNSSCPLPPCGDPVGCHPQRDGWADSAGKLPRELQLTNEFFVLFHKISGSPSSRFFVATIFQKKGVLYATRPCPLVACRLQTHRAAPACRGVARNAPRGVRLPRSK
jgi:hypothetical protein